MAVDFIEPTKEIAATIKRTTGHEAGSSFGANGQSYSHISQGAPFQIVFSADDARSRELVVHGITEPKKRFIYTIGELVLWKKPANFVDGAEMFEAVAFAKLSICNPAETFHRVTAVEAVRSLSVHEGMQPKGAEAANVTPADESCDDDLAPVAISQLLSNEPASRWLMPQELDNPSRQGAAPPKSRRRRRGGAGLYKISERVGGSRDHRALRLRRSKPELDRMDTFSAGIWQSARPTIGVASLTSRVPTA
ncbi:molybdate ABC transporter substrate-binding protein [Bradyrhizobium sp. USDA 10063]